MEVEWRLVKRYAQTAKRYFGDNLLAFAVFGSLARGEAKFPESDIDLLIVLKNVTGTIGKRIEMLSEVEKELEKTEEYRDFLNKYRWKPVFQEHVLSEKELSMHPPLLLDLVHDAVIIYDTGVLERELRIVEEKLKKLGAKRVEKGKDRFWVLKPDIKPGEVIEI